MQNIPLHPLVVHFPVALAVLTPLVALYLVASLWWRRELPRSWPLLPVLLALVLLGGFAAARTGEAEEERVEPFVGEAALAAHEELAESLLPIAGAVLAVAVAVPIVRRKRALRASLAVLALVGCVALAAVTARIGHSGGELVYARGAARAYAESGPRSAALLGPGDPGNRATTPSNDPIATQGDAVRENEERDDD